MRSLKEISERAIVLFSVVEASDRENRVEIRDWLKSQNLWGSVSPNEKKLFGKAKVSEKQLINASWRVEALEAVVWALGHLPELSPSSEQCDYDAIEDIFEFFLKDSTTFFEESKLRTTAEIQSTLDNIYDQHWKVRDAKINKKEIPNNLDAGVIREKHYALNWMTGYENQDWDNVSTDT
jgi:hypothetical protein